MDNTNPVGRPSLYNEQMQAKADDYKFRYSEQGDVVPSRAGLCCWLGISRSTSYDWEKAHVQFMHTLEAISVLQENIALNKSLTGDFNATISKLLLANHGYSDAQKVDHTTKGESLQPQVIEIVAPKTKN